MHDNIIVCFIFHEVYLIRGFKTVNGMGACTTTIRDVNLAIQLKIWFQNRKRYGGMHDLRQKMHLDTLI